MTRRPLSEAMKFTVFTRGSRSTVSRKCFRNSDPLAPVVATVRFSGGRRGKVGAPRGPVSVHGLEKLRIGTREKQVKVREACCHPERSERICSLLALRTTDDRRPTTHLWQP